MSSQTGSFRFDVASGLDRGDRPYQEDCLATDFAVGERGGFALLADGMGAHSAGDLASTLVVGEMFSFLKSQKPVLSVSPHSTPPVLIQGVEAANEKLATAAESRPDARGMGATLVAFTIIEDQLFWVSIGDSPLFLYRRGNLRRLNQDHSMAPQIDAMVATGQISAAAAAAHPDRNVLMSAVTGDEIAKIDCPKESLTLEDGDILILASDGLQSLKDEEITKTVRRCAQRGSEDLVRALLQSVEERQVPDQDNVSLVAIRVATLVTGVSALTLPPPKPTSDTPHPANSDHATRNVAESIDEIEEAPDFLKQALS